MAELGEGPPPEPKMNQTVPPPMMSSQDRPPPRHPPSSLPPPPIQVCKSSTILYSISYTDSKVNPFWKFVPLLRFYLDELLQHRISFHFFINDTRGAFHWDDLDQNQWSKITWIMLHQNMMNPLWTRIHQFIWCAMIGVILDHIRWSWSGSSHRKCTLSFKELKKTRENIRLTFLQCLILCGNNTLCSFLFGF